MKKNNIKITKIASSSVTGIVNDIPKVTVNMTASSSKPIKVGKTKKEPKVLAFKAKFRGYGTKYLQLPIGQSGMLCYGKHSIQVHKFAFESNSYQLGYLLADVQLEFNLTPAIFKLAIKHNADCQTLNTVSTEGKKVKQVFVNQLLLNLLASHAVLLQTESLIAQHVQHVGMMMDHHVSTAGL